MAYTSGYKHDIFISYAHDDNEVPEGETGWVSQFHDYLKNWLTERRHLKKMKIWFDDNALQGNTAFDKAIQKSIEQSALFFVIHSQNYQDSAYCKKELDWFHNHNNSSPNGVMLGDESRIFNILINNIHYNDWPEALAGVGDQKTSGFALHDAQEDADFGYPTLPRKELFDRQMRKLVEATVSILDAMPKAQHQNHNQVETAESGPKIFLADVADTLQPFRKRLINEIKTNDETAIILPSMPPPYEAQEHQQELTKKLEQASLSIHLLDQWPGRTVDGMEDRTFPQL